MWRKVTHIQPVDQRNAFHVVKQTYDSEMGSEVVVTRMPEKSSMESTSMMGAQRPYSSLTAKYAFK